jgi:DNA-binding MarR family transcriptional regulator/DNA-binding transcriptional regulator YiaG
MIDEKINQRSSCLTCSHLSSQLKRKRGDLTLEEIELIRKLRGQNLPNKQICNQLGISYPTLAKWIRKLTLPKKYEEGREKKLKQIYSTIERLGCCTIKEVSEETKIPAHTTQKYINYLLKKGKIERSAIRRGGKSKLTHRGAELFGESSGLVLFYADKREVISRLLDTITSSQDRGTKSALTHNLKNFGFTKAEIEEINRERIIQENKVNLQLKKRDIENLQGLISNNSANQFFGGLINKPVESASFSLTFLG